MTTHRLGIDIGGTFTDFTFIDNDTGATRILKIPSNPTNPEEAIFDGLQQLFTQHGRRARQYHATSSMAPRWR